jgi:hypothetical protein
LFLVTLCDSQLASHPILNNLFGTVERMKTDGATVPAPAVEKYDHPERVLRRMTGLEKMGDKTKRPPLIRTMALEDVVRRRSMSTGDCAQLNTRQLNRKHCTC